MIRITKSTSIMVTGGTGSFGNAMIDHLLLTTDVGKILVYSRDESKQHDMFIQRRDDRIQYCIGDVRDRNKLEQAMRDVDYVFHAAALKHVPTGELWPEEAVYTNVMGTRNVIEAAEQCDVRKVVILSTDKAAYPVSAYGMSKAIAEKFVQAHTGDTANVCLRYGNVLGSRGSVVPLFLDLIRKGELLTVTNETMTRFIMTLEEAVKIAMRCLTDGVDGELFIMRPPACTIRTLVQALELHFGRVLDRRVIGIRPGEKMHEVLLTGSEVHRSWDEKSDGITYSRVPPQRGRDYHFIGEDYVEPPAYSSDVAEQLDARQVLDKLKEARLL